jgi:hypothetical protein
MALSPADLEWIRRLPAHPSPEEQGILRAMRRGARGKDEVRLLESLLAPIGRTNAQSQERAELEQRLAVIDDALSDEGRERAHAAVRRGALRIVNHRASAARRTPLESDHAAAIEAARADAKERRQAMAKERSEITKRLGEIRKAERRAARASA